MMTNSISFGASNSVLLQMPMQEPVYKRERANQMYTPFSYYFGRFISHLILQSFYPFVYVSITVFTLSIEPTLEIVGRIYAVAFMLNIVMAAQGWACSSISGEPMIGSAVNLIVIMLFMLTSGGLGSAAAFPIWIEWLTHVSPMRYGVEGFFRCLISNVPEANGQRDRVVSQMGYDLLPGGEDRILWVLLADFVVFCLIGWFALELRSRK